MSAPTLHLEIVTPEARIFAGDVTTVTVPGVEGELGIYPQHTPLVVELQPGELLYVLNGESLSLAVGQGFAEVTGQSVAVLTDLAVREKEIDEKVVEEAMARAEEALRSKTLIGEELEATQAVIARSIAQLRIKRRHRHQDQHLPS